MDESADLSVILDGVAVRYGSLTSRHECCRRKLSAVTRTFGPSIPDRRSFGAPWTFLVIPRARQWPKSWPVRYCFKRANIPYPQCLDQTACEQKLALPLERSAQGEGLGNRDRKRLDPSAHKSPRTIETKDDLCSDLSRFGRPQNDGRSRNSGTNHDGVKSRQPPRARRAE